MSRTPRAAGTALLMAGTLAAGLALAPPAQAADESEPDFVHPDPHAQLEEFTDEDLAQSEPVDMPVLQGGDSGYDGYDRHPQAAAMAPAEGPLLTPGADPRGYALAPEPYADHRNSRQTGKLLVKQEDGSVGDCSASVVDSERGTLVVTAAHCVYTAPDEKDRKLSTNVVFVPSYNGTAEDGEPFGRWAVEEWYVLDKWTRAKSLDEGIPYDVAVLSMAPDKQGRTIQEVVGAGFESEQNTDESFERLAVAGYPAEPEDTYDGEQLRYCVGDAADAGQSPLGSLVTKNCGVRGGNSGGPVFTRDGRIVAVNSSRSDYGEAPEDYANSLWARLAPQTFGALYDGADEA